MRPGRALRRLYTLLLRLAVPLILLRLWWRGRQTPAYRQRWRERFGLPSGARPTSLAPLWFHCVSVGETLAAKPLIEAFRARHPDVPLLVTTMTPTGSACVHATWGDAVQHVYAPYDLPGAIARFLAHWRPRALVILETELWPNTIAQARVAGLPVMLANARLSVRSARGYGRAGGLARALMADLSVIAAQDAETAERFRALGAHADAVQVTGTLKIDLAVPDDLPARAQALRATWSLAGRPVWVAASTHDGEDALVLEAHRALLAAHPQILLVLVPRHPERFEAVARLIRDSGLTSVRRRQGVPVTPGTAVLLGDSMGELLLWLALADAALVGGSLLPPGGGHNVLEPLALGVPALTGPHYANFQALNDSLLAAGALAVVADADALATALHALFTDPALAATRRAAGLAVIAANRGAVARQLALLEALLDRSPRA